MHESGIDTVKALKLYRSGLNDREIAAQCSVCTASICKLRSRNGLPPNCRTSKTEPLYRDIPKKPKKNIVRDCTTCRNMACRRKWGAVVWKNCRGWLPKKALEEKKSVQNRD